MKVYYDTPDEIEDHEEAINKVINELPGFVNAELLPRIQNILRTYDKLQRNWTIQYLERMKYQIMWYLRSLENEINEEGGIIIVTSEAKVETKSFSPELTEKIHQALSDGFK